MLYTDSGSPIPNDKPMEQFKASEEGWRKIERSAENPAADYSRAVCELRDRVAALEAASDRVLVRSQTGEYLRAGTPAYLAAPAAPEPEEAASSQWVSDEELWELRRDTLSQADPHIVCVEWKHAHPLAFTHAHIKGNRALYDYGYEDGLAAGRAEQQAAPEDSSAAQSEPEPSPSPAAGLVEEVLDAMGEGTEVEARKAICKVAARARAHDLNGMSPAAMTWEGVARWLEQEANR
jgi:hypothetical protein